MNFLLPFSIVSSVTLLSFTFHLVFSKSYYGCAPTSLRPSADTDHTLNPSLRRWSSHGDWVDATCHPFMPGSSPYERCVWWNGPGVCGRGILQCRGWAHNEQTVLKQQPLIISFDTSLSSHMWDAQLSRSERDHRIIIVTTSACGLPMIPNNWGHGPSHRTTPYSHTHTTGTPSSLRDGNVNSTRSALSRTEPLDFTGRPIPGRGGRRLTTKEMV